MPEPTDWLDQPAHFLMGFGARLLYLDLLLWNREAVTQWPPETARFPVLYVDMRNGSQTRWSASINQVYGQTVYLSEERVRDMLKDMKWYMIGATCAEPFRWALVIWGICG